MKLRNGQQVQLTNLYGSTTGELVLNEWEKRWGGSGYAVHTLRLADGRLYRSEGRLTPA